MQKKFLASITALIALQGISSAAEMQYPELQVTPRASERIEIEARNERRTQWTKHWPIALSGLTTLVAGAAFQAKDPENTNARIAGLAVGAGWVGMAVVLSAVYTPYQSASEELKKYPSRTPREQLVRERLAEEDMESAARLGRRLKWLSLFSNLGASAYMVTSAEKSSFSQVMAGVAAVASITPLIFRYSWETIDDDQKEYKKKVYGPIASAGFLPDVSRGTLVPGLNLALAF